MILEIENYGYDTRGYFLMSGLFFQFIGANFFIGFFQLWDSSAFLVKIRSYFIRSGRGAFGIYLLHLLLIEVFLLLWRSSNIEAGR